MEELEGGAAPLPLPFSRNSGMRSSWLTNPLPPARASNQSFHSSGETCPLPSRSIRPNWDLARAVARASGESADQSKSSLVSVPSRSLSSASNHSRGPPNSSNETPLSPSRSHRRRSHSQSYRD